VLVLSTYDVECMQNHALGCAPEECCGLLVGTPLRHTERWVRAVIPVPNRAAHERSRQFVIAPADLLAAERHARDTKCSVIGVYHSHPNGAAAPSPQDLRFAQPDWSYVVVAGSASGGAALHSWRVRASGSLSCVPEATRIVPAHDWAREQPLSHHAQPC
jgi:proteasome lid subunit RPN8/RPN11